MVDLERADKDIEAYLFNLITARCRFFEVDDHKALYFSRRLNVSKIVKEDVLKVIDSAIEQEIHGENIPFSERNSP